LPAGPGSLDLTFDPTGGLQLVGPTCEAGRVMCVAQQVDGRTMIGGTFVGVNGRPRNRIARLLTNGTLDESFNPGRGVDGTVEAIAVQGDGRILLVGGFTSFNGTACNGAVRLHPNGTLDPSFTPPVFQPAHSPPACVTIQADGRILLGGGFQQVNGLPRLGIARFHPDGSMDPTFDASAVMSYDFATVRAIRFQLDGKILVAGFFSATDRPVLRLNPDGSEDTSFQSPEIETHPGSNLGFVFSLSLDSTERIVIVGQFERVNGVERSNIARLNPQGALDLSFAPAAVIGHHPVVTRVTHLPDGRILVGGQFTHLGGFERRGLARLLPSSAVDSTFDPGHAFGTPELMAWINDMALAVDGRLSVAAGAEPHSCCPVSRPLSRLNSDGSLDLSFGTPTVVHPAALSVIAAQTNGKLLVSQGLSCTYNGQSRVPVARLNANGTLDPTFTAGFTSDVVSAIVVQPDGKLLVGGTVFTFPDGRLMRGLLRLRADGSLDPTFEVEESPLMHDEADDFYVPDLLLQPDGRIIVLGSFRQLRGAPRSCIARLHPDGSLDASFEFVPPDPLYYDEYTTPIHCVALEADGHVLIGASFNDSSVRLLRLSATGAIASELLPRESLSMVNKIIVQPDRMILVAGSMHFGPDDDWATLVRVNPSGSVDTGFTPMVDAQLNTLALQPDGRILVAYNSGGPALARLNADGTPDGSFVADIRSGVWPGHVSRIVLQSDGQVLVGGSFSSVSGLPWHGMARLNNDLVIPVAFVQRDVTSPLYIPTGSTYEIMLYAHPVSGVTVYAVEDRVPPGWTVSEITFGGVLDAAAGKVKFGPFFDDDWRTLGYQVTPTPGATNAQCFEGVGSADGVNTLVTGRNCMVPSVPQPADTLQPTWSITIDEATAYGAAWRRGESWPRPPVPIPIDYVTRAGALWRGGECYQVDRDGLTAPLWWVNCAQINQPNALTLAAAALATLATRQLPAAFVPGEPVGVSIAVTPSPNATAGAIEDRPPPGWAVSAISHGGGLDAVSGRVRWGPFFDASPRTLTYQTTPPILAGGGADFTGLASFDGLSTAIAGAARMREVCRLSGWVRIAQDRFQLTVTGRAGARIALETSEDLTAWTPLVMLTNTPGRLEFSDPAGLNYSQRFYRAQLVE
jgi:uncharacterized delta-60 repeat protein